MPKRLIQSFIPWVIFFICFGYDELVFKVGASGALVALVLLGKQGLKRGYIFDWGSLLFFVFIFVSVIVFYQPWIAGNASLLANCALTVIAWVSLLINRPFTLQYARMMVAKEYWQTDLFKHLNRRLTLIWALVFTAMTVFEFLELNNTGSTFWFAQIVSLGLVMVAIWVTSWFPDWYKTRKIGQGGLLNLYGLSDLHKITTDSAEISYRTIGHGPVLLLLPDANMTMYTWDVAFIQNLSRSYQVIVVDYPGINESVMHSGEFSVEGLAKIFLEFIEVLHLKAVTLVGYSMGGWIAELIALNDEQRLDSLVLIATDAGGLRATPTSGDVLQQLIQPMSSEDKFKLICETLFGLRFAEEMAPKLRALVVSGGHLTNVSLAILKQQLRLTQAWLDGQGSYKRLLNIRIPTLVITGILDQVIHRQNALVLANGIPNACLVEYPLGGHGVIYQYPIEISLEIAKLLK